MDARRVVMISCTARDLPEHREQVRLACERAGFAPHDMMEHLTALDTAGVAQHVWVRLQFEAAADGRAFDHPGKACSREWRAPLADEHEG